MELCQHVLDGKEMPTDWKIIVVVPVFKGKEDVMNYGSYRGGKSLKHTLKVLERCWRGKYEQW